MAQTIVMPRLGQTVEEATIVSWHKQKGDPVKKGDILFEIETDKAVLEVESFYDGILLKVLIGEGETVPVSTIVAYVGKKGEPVPKRAEGGGMKPEEAKPPAPVPERKEPEVEPAKKERQREVVVSVSAALPSPQVSSFIHQPSGASKRILMSPRARALAKNKAIDPSKISGTGSNGRIVVKDIEAYLEAAGYNNLRISPAARKLAREKGIDILTVRGTGIGGRIMVHDVERAIATQPKAMSKMRQVIARRLTQSFTSTPHFYVTVSVDMTDLLVYRQELKDQGKNFTVTDFILKAVILSLQEFPTVNSVTDGTTVKWFDSVDLGMAVGLDDGLVVPVLRNAQNLSMTEIHDLAESLAAKARERKLLPDEMTGSTFTVSNMGMMNVENFCAIINPGEGGILAVASTVSTPVARNGKVEVRSMMKITLSCDHRIIDGAVGAAFVNAIKSKLENVKLWKSLM